METSPLQRATLSMVLLSSFSTPLMLSSVNVALPVIARDLQLTAVTLSWVPLAYLLASAMFVLACGRLADRFGRTRVFVAGSAGVLASSILAAMAADGAQLVSLRFVQGMFTAALYATQVAIVSAAFPPARRGQAIGLTISSVYLGLTVGPALGGWLLHAFGWRACLLVQVPFSLIVLWMGRRTERDDDAQGARSFDLPGMALFALSLTLLTLGGTGLPATQAKVLLAAGGLVAVAFFVIERRAPDPLVDLRLFLGNRVFGLSCLSSFLMYTATFANVVLVGLYLQYLKDMPPNRAGLMMMAQPLTMAVFAPIAGRLSDRIEPRYLASGGMVLTVVGLVGLGMLTPQSTLPHVVAALVVTGLGFGLFSAPNTNAILGSVERRLYNTANSQVAMMRMLGQMCSMGIIGVVFALLIGAVTITPEVYGKLEVALRVCYLTAAACCVPAIFFSLARGDVHGGRRPG
jgi:EmrB/QacA subfamily drug resistance transporter